MKTALIIVGIVLLVIFIVFLYLLITGSDESRRKARNKDRQEIDK